MGLWRMGLRNALALFRVFHCTMLTRFSQCGPIYQFGKALRFRGLVLGSTIPRHSHGETHCMKIINESKESDFRFNRSNWKETKDVGIDLDEIEGESRPGNPYRLRIPYAN